MRFLAVLLEPRVVVALLLPAAVCALAALAGLWLARRRAGAPAWPPRARLGDTGSATIFDFVLVIEFVLIFSGLLVQYGLMTHGLLVVQQAAYWAGRAASVYIPTFYPEQKVADANSGQTPSHLGVLKAVTGLAGVIPGEPSLPAAADTSKPELCDEYGPLKKERVKMAAAVACLPASPNLITVVNNLAEPLAGDSLSSLTQSLTAGPLGALGELAGRLAYAWRYTQVDLEYFGKSFDSVATFSTGDDGKATADQYAKSWTVRSRVTFRYYLAVPFARRILTGRWTGLWGVPSEEKELARSGSSTTAHGKEYIPLIPNNAGAGYVELQASWIFFRENGYWGAEQS